MEKKPPAIKPKNMLLAGVTLAVLALGLLGSYFFYYQDKFYPFVSIDGQAVGGLTLTEARQELVRAAETQDIDWQNSQLQLYSGEASVSASLSELNIAPDFNHSLTQAWAASRNLLDFSEKKYHTRIELDLVKIKMLLEALKVDSYEPGEAPNIALAAGVLRINPGSPDSSLNVEKSLILIKQQLVSKPLSELKLADLTLQFDSEQHIQPLSEEEIELVRTRAQKFLQASLKLSFDYQNEILSAAQLLSFLELPQGIDQATITQYLTELAEAKINRPSQDAVFNYDPNTLKVSEFSADLDGLELDATAAAALISDWLMQIEAAEESELTALLQGEITLPLQSSPAAIQLKDTNDLGISEVIGFGESWYQGSIPNRIYNVDLSSRRISHHIVAPDQEFSFNQALGPVGAETGYRDAYIIEGGMTKLSAGGGVCQVSSTLFRALLDSGIEVTRRLPHAYRVPYYEIGNEPGFDATVYSGNVDLRFRNDTPAHVLVECNSNSQTLYMNCKLYGTSDGRTTEIVNYRNWDQRPSLPPVYISDPSLQPGQIKQIDWSASGIKAEFTNIVRDRNGAVLREDKYYSNYRPWAAKYLRGE